VHDFLRPPLSTDFDVSYWEPPYIGRSGSIASAVAGMILASLATHHPVCPHQAMGLSQQCRDRHSISTPNELTSSPRFTGPLSMAVPEITVPANSFFHEPSVGYVTFKFLLPGPFSMLQFGNDIMAPLPSMLIHSH